MRALQTRRRTDVVVVGPKTMRKTAFFFFLIFSGTYAVFFLLFFDVSYRLVFFECILNNAYKYENTRARLTWKENITVSGVGGGTHALLTRDSPSGNARKNVYLYTRKRVTPSGNALLLRRWARRTTRDVVFDPSRSFSCPRPRRHTNYNNNTSNSG